LSALEGKRILLGITGGIAAYKTPDLVRALVREGAEVQVVLTESAQRFVSPLALEVVSGRGVGTSLWATREHDDNREISHTEWGREADAIVVAPTTAHALARTALGLAGDLLDNILLASTCPVLLVPSMNELMYDNPIVQGHMKSLEATSRFSLLEPDTGHLACNIVGKGRMPDPNVIVSALADLFGPGSLEGKKVVITAGPTREPLDPARFLSNPSSGKMGFALATEAVKRGATVTLIHGPVTLAVPNGAHCVPVERAEEMKHAVVTALQDAHILVMAAAVADWSPVETASRKEEKQGETKTVLFKRTPDILSDTKDIGNALRVGFAAQTHDLEIQAKRKLEEKGLDLIVGNPIGGPEAGFATDTNEGMVLTRGGALHRIPRMSKSEFACQVMDQIENALPGGAS